MALLDTIVGVGAAVTMSVFGYTHARIGFFARTAQAGDDKLWNAVNENKKEADTRWSALIESRFTKSDAAEMERRIMEAIRRTGRRN